MTDALLEPSWWNPLEQPIKRTVPASRVHDSEFSKPDLPTPELAAWRAARRAHHRARLSALGLTGINLHRAAEKAMNRDAVKIDGGRGPLVDDAYQRIRASRRAVTGEADDDLACDPPPGLRLHLPGIANRL